jgi:Lrp/AsnC family leucine-responsive transcriptional regulator
MDKKDHLILVELEKNSRIPINQLAKKVGVSKEVANYRLKRLVKEGIIGEFYAVVNTETLGFSRSTCLVQLKNITSSQEKEFMDYLKKHDFITYLGPSLGKWSLSFDVLYKDKLVLDATIKEISSKIHNKIESLIFIGSTIDFEAFPLKIIGINDEVIFDKKTENVKIDKIDFKILELMSDNSRIEYKELSSKLKMSANAIKYRIKNMEKSGVIQGYTITINVQKLGYEWHNIQVKLTNLNKENEIKSFLRKDKNVNYFYRYLGNENWDLDIGVVVKNSMELRDFLLLLRERFGDSMKINDIYSIVELTKGNYAPKGVFK